VCGELREGHVFNADLHPHRLDWQRRVADAVGHDGKDVCYSVK
jgi:hypothetical protein